MLDSVCSILEKSFTAEDAEIAEVLKPFPVPYCPSIHWFAVMAKSRKFTIPSLLISEGR